MNSPDAFLMVWAERACFQQYKHWLPAVVAEGANTSVGLARASAEEVGLAL